MLRGFDLFLLVVVSYLVYVTSKVESVTSLQDRIKNIEDNYVDERRTYLIKNHKAGKYLNSNGTPSAEKHDTYAHYSLERD